MIKEPLSITQTKVIKAKVEAELKDIPQSTIAQEVFPNQTPGAAAVSMSRELKKANVQEALHDALEKHGITIEKATKPIADGLTASQDFTDKNGNTVSKPDHSIRLKASGMALKLMGAEKDESKGNTYIFNKGDVVSNKYVKD